MFTGSIVALVTPMLGDGQVDYGSLKALVDFHVQQGTEGIVAVGTTGESATLPIDEHVHVVAKIVEYVAGRVPVIAGCGANSTAEAIELTELCQQSGVDALLSVVPYYNKPQQRGLVKHFQCIADVATVPVILYNVPGRTVTDISTAAVVELAAHPMIIGIKDATGDLARLAELRAHLPQDFLLLSGDDETCCQFMLEGGHGVISVTTNVAPSSMRELCNLARQGRVERAKHIDQQLQKLHSTLFIESNPVMPKYALYRLGVISSPALRLPLVEAELSNKAILESVLKDIGIIQTKENYDS